jgi:hypothetical protein
MGNQGGTSSLGVVGGGFVRVDNDSRSDHCNGLCETLIDVNDKTKSKGKREVL